jgi:hypothetical protein
MCGRRAAALWGAIIVWAWAAVAVAQPARRGPLDGLAFAVTITHGGRHVGRTTLRFERGWLITSGRRWRDRVRYRWHERDGILYFSAATAPPAPGAPAGETREYDGSVHGGTLKAIYSSKQGSETLSYDFSGRREPRLYGVAGSSGPRTRSR